MTLTLFRALLATIARTFQRRLGDATAPLQGNPVTLSEKELGEAITPLVWAARRQAWAATALFLRGQARAHGANEAWIPPQPGYSPDSVRYAIRSTKARSGKPEAFKALQGELTSHVYAASRRTINDAVEDAPDVAELLDDLERIADDLEGFSKEQASQIEREVKKHERKRRPRRNWVDVFDEVADRVDKAIKELESEGMLTQKYRDSEALKDLPDKYRRAKDGTLIARPFAWARVVAPSKNGPCGFCAMLASRGPVYKTSESAGVRVDRYHVNCVVGDTRVSGPSAEVGYRRRYEGEVVTLVTAGGNELTVTPNHPVLTDRGWVRAGDVQEGDNLVSGSFGDGYLRLGPDKDETPPSIEDVVSALSMIGAPVEGGVPTSTEEFHGDGGDSEVDIIARYDLFGHEGNTALGEPSLEGGLKMGAPPFAGGSFSGSGFGQAELLRGGALSAGESLASLCPEHFELFLRGVLPAEESGFVGASDGEAGFLEPAHDNSPADVESARHFVDAFSGSVDLVDVGGCGDALGGGAPGFGDRFDPPAAESETERLSVFAEYGCRLLERLGLLVKTDRVLDKRVREFSGHVYNLQTSEGWYSANSIIVSNCKCEAVPIYTSRAWPGKEQHARFEQLYNEVVKARDLHGHEALRAMNRRLYQEQRRRNG